MTNTTDLLTAITLLGSGTLSATAIATIATRPARARRRWARIIRNAAP